MKFAIATLLTGGTLLAGTDMPTPGYDECSIVATDVAYGEPTFVEPEPAAESMRLFVYCGQRVPNSTGSGSHNERSVKWIDVDREQAEIIVGAADDLLNDGEVYLP